MDLNANDILHITIGASTTGKVDLTHDLRLIKAAMLYADKVKLISLTSSMLISVLPMFSLTEDQTIDFLIETLPTLNREQSPQILSLFQMYRQLKKKKYRSSQELIRLNKIQRMINKTRTDLQEAIETQAKEAGIEGLLEAFQTGLVEFELLDITESKIVENYFENIKAVLLSNKTYPLFDDATSDLVSAAIKEGKIQVVGSTLMKSRQVGLSSGLFERLPLFDNATIDEIKDIRKELEKPLIRFRSAIIKFSKDIAAAQWEKEFPFEVDQVFHETVEPTVLEIEEGYRSNSLLMKLVKSYSEKPLLLPSTSALGLLLSHASQLPEILTGALGVVAGAAIIGLDAVNDWREKDVELHNNQLYFYYRAKKKLE